MKKMIVFFTALALTFVFSFDAEALSVSQKMSSVKLFRLSKKGKKEKWVQGWIPYVGKKVISIMYTDVDNADMNDPLSDAIKARNYDKGKYKAIGIGNSKDAPLKPDVFIRMAAKKKMRDYPGSIILLDEDRTFSTKLGLGKCNGKAVVIILDKLLK